MCLYGHRLKNLDMRSTSKAKLLRGKLLIHGMTVREFSRRHDFNERTVKAALRGERPTGKKTLLVLRKIAEVTA